MKTICSLLHRVDSSDPIFFTDFERVEDALRRHAKTGGKIKTGRWGYMVEHHTRYAHIVHDIQTRPGEWTNAVHILVPSADQVDYWKRAIYVESWDDVSEDPKYALSEKEQFEFDFS
jgi:hypothetical protein